MGHSCAAHHIFRKGIQLFIRPPDDIKVALFTFFILNFFKQFVANHVVPGLFNTHLFKPNLVYKLPSLFGSLSVCLSKENSSDITVKGAKVTKSDCMNTNGVVHVVDKVLMPEPNDDPVAAEPLSAA